MRCYENRSMASNVSMGSGVHDPIQRRKKRRKRRRKKKNNNNNKKKKTPVI
jgi:hypothetical protein